MGKSGVDIIILIENIFNHLNNVDSKLDDIAENVTKNQVLLMNHLAHHEKFVNRLLKVAAIIATAVSGIGIYIFT